MKPRKGKPMVARPYVSDSVNDASSSQHAIVRRLGPNALWNPAFEEIRQAADELAEELGKSVAEFTDEDADRAIELGKQRRDEGR